MDGQQFEKKPQNRQPSEQASLLSKLFFGWSLPLFYNRYKREFTEDELYQPLPSHQSSKLGDKLEQAWSQETAVSSHPSLWRALCKTFHLQFLALALLFVSSECVLKMSQPWLIGKLMSQYNSTTRKDNIYFYGSLLLINNFLSVMVAHNYQLHIQHLGLKIRVACCSLIYRKALKLSKTTLAELTVGKMINMLTNDVNRFDLAAMHTLQLFVAPLETLFVIGCLYVTVGPTAIAGILFLLLFVPLQMYIGKLTSLFRRRTAAKSDQRIKLMNEIISGIQLIKMYTWERLFAKLIGESRKKEIRQISYLSYLRGFNSSFMIFMNRTGIFLCILIYAITQEKIDAEYVFVVSSFYAILRQALTVYFPFGISNFSETRVSVSRIRNFLIEQELPSQEVVTYVAVDGKLVRESASDLNENPSGEVGIHLDNVSVRWNSEQCVLEHVNFEASSSELVVITGPVGSGKSTFLYTILQEIPLVQGWLSVHGKISYAAQEPWLFSGTVRQNIIFGSDYDKDKYAKVVEICGLAEDFSRLPNGDGAQVGDRGVMLSGGQKARINLARAVYKDADIYLLDDPFAAVDIKVGKKIFQECILGYLKDKCTVLVTHHIRYLGKGGKVYGIDQNRMTQQPIDDAEEEVASSSDEEKVDLDLEIRTVEGIKEERKTGTISRQVYNKYVKAGGNRCRVFVLSLLFILTQAGASGADYFLGFWVNIEESDGKSTLFTHHNCISIYIAIISFTIFISIVRSTMFFRFCVKASENLHNMMLSNVITASMRFFNMNPSGMILNRFTKDMGLTDEILPVTMMDTFQIAFVVVGSTLIVTILYPWMILPTAVIFTLFYFFRKMFLATSRNLKRLEAAKRSPIYSHFNASLNGLTTIRSYNVQNLLRSEFDHYQDIHSSAFYMFMTCNRAFGFWLDMNCVFYIIIVILSIMLIDTSVGDVGLGITQSINLIGVFQWGIRQWSEMENQMVSVERIVEYTNMVPEKRLNDEEPVRENWPSDGHISFDQVSLQYSTIEPPVLHQVSFEVRPKEKIGIVGRTGAGKSSLISALFQLFKTQGEIAIDGVDVTQVPLTNLRAKISIIPQEPTLFAGTLRKNLDPFNAFDDNKVWWALEQVDLKSSVEKLSDQLYSEISEGGSNFSVGQRQLICLARAILKDNKILVLDEATANVDLPTDQLIQDTIKKNFNDCTVLTVAHRLHTIMDSDKVLVMDAGRVVEFDHAYKLLQNPDSVFSQLVEESGKEMAESLARVAEQDYEKKH